MKSALVTGAGKRLGRAIALSLSKDHHVLVHYFRSEKGASETAESIISNGGSASLFQADLRTEDACLSLAKRVSSIDTLVLSAANFHRTAIEDASAADLRRSLSLNLEAPFTLTMALKSKLAESKDGNVVCVTGFGAHRPYKNYAPYLISKGALRTMVKVLALELAPQVRINAVAPGTVLPPETLSPEQIESLAKKTALGSIGNPEDVARAVAYFAAASNTTGAELLVDGGATIFATR